VFTGDTIRSLRDALGMTAGQFAALIGVHPATLYRWEAKKGGTARLDPMQHRLLAVIHERLQASVDRDEWTRVLRNDLLIGGGLYALYRLLSSVFDP